MAVETMLPGRITITRPSHGNRDGNYISITIVDESSRARMIEVEIPVAEFALALTGLSEQCCSFAPGAFEIAGWTREHKRVDVPDNHSRRWLKYEDKREAAREAVAPFEIDGWECNYLEDFGNMHRYDRETKTYSMGLVRFVPPVTEVTDAS